MSKEQRRRRGYNRIWFAAAVVVLGVLAFWSTRAFLPESVALEQDVRCGMNEHIHTDGCYYEDILVCTGKMHVHDEQCYLVLLKDNDINELLSSVHKNKDKSLEGLLSDTVTNALTAAEGGDPAADKGDSVTDLLRAGVTVGELNRVLTVYAGSSLTLNADLAAGARAAIIDGSASTASNAANFYVWFVDEDGTGAWTYIGYLTHASATISGNNNYRAVTRANLARLIANAMPGVSYTNNGLPTCYHATSATSTSWTQSQTSNTYIAVRNNKNQQLRYVRIGGSGNNPSLKFCRVSYAYPDNYPGTEHSPVYLISGNRVTLPALPDGYVWMDSAGTRYEGTPTISNITRSLIFTAVENRYTARFIHNGATYHTISDIPPNSTISSPGAPTPPAGHTFGGWYTDAACTQKYDFSSPVTSDLTLYAGWDPVPCLVTMVYQNSSGTPIRSETSTVGYGSTLTLPAGYLWVDGSGNGWYAGQTVTVTGDIQFIGTLRTCTVTYIDGENTSGSVYDYDTVITLPPVESGTYWITGSAVYSPGDSYTVTNDVTFTATDRVAAAFVYKDKDPSSVSLLPGGTVTMPSDIARGHVWTDGEGNVYQPGETVTLLSNTTFTEKSTLTVTYNVNFSDSGLTSSAPPILAETGGSTAAVTVVEGTATALYTVDPRAYISSLTEGEAAYFTGWAPAADSGAMFAPGTNLPWDTLRRYAVNGTVALTGDWSRDSTNNITDVRFYVRFDSIAPDINGAVGSYGTNYYTSQIYHAYAGNAPAHNSGFTIADKTADNSYTADRTIRALVGDKGDGELWISGVPDDAWLLDQLKTFTREQQTTTQVNNNEYLRIHVGKDAYGRDVYEDVLASELDTDHYSIRWYVFKKESDGWHVDGRLVRKKGQFAVSKTFGGIEDAVKQAHDGFCILAENGYLDSSGTFIPYPDSDSRYNTHILVMSPSSTTAAGAARIAAIQNAYPKAILQAYSSETNIEGELVDAWLISDVELDENWRFTEYAPAPTYRDPLGNDVPYSWYAEYTVSDSDGEVSQIAQFGSVAQVIGKTYALDADPDQGMSVSFTNYYYSNESILIRKIDGDTGQPLSGAEFQLWQRDSQLKFIDNGNGVYTVSPEGVIGSIVTNAEGFSVITIDGFSFENGELVVKEVAAPSGYDVVNDITIDYTGELDEHEVPIADITGIAGADPSHFDYHAEYYDENGGVLVVKDHSSHYTSVTVNKVWADAVRADSVTVVLQANGGNAAILFPSLTGHQQVLSAANNWTYTWNSLPAYANGEPVEWSVKEILIGSETTMVGSDTFANWIVTYSIPAKTDYDGDGIPENWAVTVTNTVRRTLLYVTKTDLSGSTPLSGASFTLTEVEWVDGAWVNKAGAITHTGTTGSDGLVLFDNLTPGAFYSLIETKPPSGYQITQNKTVLTVTGMGVVYGVTDGTADTATLSGAYVNYVNPYVITVKNSVLPPLPSTGGTGTHWYIQAGLLLMLAALGLSVHRRKRRKGESRSS